MMAMLTQEGAGAPGAAANAVGFGRALHGANLFGVDFDPRCFYASRKALAHAFGPGIFKRTTVDEVEDPRARWCATRHAPSPGRTRQTRRRAAPMWSGTAS